MQTITIHDLDDRNILAFDLRDLLALFAPASVETEWKITSPTYVEFSATGVGGERLEKLAAASATIDGTELVALANETRQVIWGDFTAASKYNWGEPWMIIRAIDSSRYEVMTSDHEVIDKVKNHFTDFRFAD